MALVSVIYDRHVKHLSIGDQPQWTGPHSHSSQHDSEPQAQEPGLLLFNMFALVHVTFGLLGVLRLYSLAMLRKEHAYLNNFFCLRSATK